MEARVLVAIYSTKCCNVVGFCLFAYKRIILYIIFCISLLSPQVTDHSILFAADSLPSGS